MFVNAELHTLATDATPDFTYTGTGNNAITPAYARWVTSSLNDVGSAYVHV